MSIFERTLWQKGVSELTLLMALGACSGSRQVPAEEPQRNSIFRGDRKESAERRTAQNIPHPWEQDHGPFETDRLAVGSAQAHRQEEHRRLHQAQASHMEGFSHPACEGLTAQLKKTCPFSSRQWTVVKMLNQGVELKTRGKFQGTLGRLLRRQILCHIAFGRGVEIKDDCPLHVVGVRASTLVGADAFVMRLETSQPGMVNELKTKAKDVN